MILAVKDWRKVFKFMSSENYEVLYQGKYLRLVNKNGWEYAERIHCKGVVFILAVTDDDKIVLCEQYRVPVGNSVIEIPAGLVSDTEATADESYEEAAIRELLEETGYQAESMSLIMEGPAAVGSSSAMIHFYRAEGIKKVASGGGDETENIIVHEVPLKEIDAWLKKKQAEKKYIEPKIFTALYFLNNSDFTCQ